ncbi:MAG: HEAT repeat domain-containing protein [Pyrinomonadaceae bacterium]|nr:HEAT repeat domain-containing protein [Pyrinomonadaceae bacterium]
MTKFADDKNPIISLWTVKALFRIDKDLALQHYFSMIAKREDWSPVLVAKLLKELTSDFISKPLSDLVGDYYIKNLPDRQMARVISYLSLAHVSDYSNLIAQIMSESNQQEILIACLRLADSEQMLPRIRKLAKDDRWQVRMQVVLALGRLGEEEDVEILVKALNDIEWWVRYRAACALTSMPFMTEEYLIELSETLPNEFARDIVKQVLAEIDLQCQTQPSSITLSR